MNILLFIFLFISFNNAQLIPGSIDSEFKKISDGLYEASVIVEYHENITISQARKNAINEARLKILEEHNGVRVKVFSHSYQSETNNKSMDHFSEIINSMTTGIITNEKVKFSGRPRSPPAPRRARAEGGFRAPPGQGVRGRHAPAKR